MAGPVAGHVPDAPRASALNPVRCTPRERGRQPASVTAYTGGENYDHPRKVREWRVRPLQDAPIKEGTVVEVHVPVEASAMRPRSIGDSPFAGMWKDREDMADSVEYINRLRGELHG